MSLTSAERVAAYRQRQSEKGLPDATRTYSKQHKQTARTRHNLDEKPFVGCDGEGCGIDDRGRQNYVLFRIGDRELFAEGRHLSTRECLDHICDTDSSSTLVGFAFGYDVTMILRDLPTAQRERLFQPKTYGKGRSPYVWYKEFDIDYLPKNYLKVRKVKIQRNSDGTQSRVPIPGSLRTIWEVFGFYQKSFLKVIQEFDVGTGEQRDTIARNKERRTSFEQIGLEERRYCELECELLAQLMEKLRGYCYDAGIHPRSWSGAGKLAAALHARHETPKWRSVAPAIPASVVYLAGLAYYGGRFEISRVGQIKGEVHEYDIRSAYPDAMRRLPCLSHGAWVRQNEKSLQQCSDLFIAPCTFEAGTDEPKAWGGLPIRSKQGHLYWPRQGGGIYWSPEIRSAERLGYKVTFKTGWSYSRRCACTPFDWVQHLYDYRRSIGSQGAGYPIKLGTNALYGKIVQRKGSSPYANMIWGGLITAITRGKINDVVGERPARVVMVATDAVYSLDRLSSPCCGDALGEWEHSSLDGMFIVQPGLYWSANRKKHKSRGLSPTKFFEENGRTLIFEKEWKHYAGLVRSGLDAHFPVVDVDFPNFIGLKLAQARNAPETAGCWRNEVRQISFDYRNKREGHSWNDDHIVLNMKPGLKGLISLPHREFLASGGHEPWEAARAMLEEQPDYVDLGPPFKD